MSEMEGERKTQAKDVSLLRRKRYLVALMVFLGVAMLSILRTNLAIAIVSMTSAKNSSEGGEIVQGNWSTFDKGLLLSCHSFFGVFGFVGGFLSCKFGGTRIFGLMIFLNGILTLFSPVTAKLGVPIFLVLRMMEGVTYTLGFGSWMQIFVSWSPSSEKFRMINYSLSGYFFGIIFTFPVCGFILEMWGWQSLFIITGGITVLWYIVWIIFIYQSPLKDKLILPEEKRFIVENIAPQPEKMDYPWNKILTSKAVWALLNERFVEAWSLSFAVECLPSFVNDSVDVSISKVGLISSLPQVCNFFGMIVAGPVGDFLRNRNILLPSKVYTVLIRIGQLTSVALLVVMALWKNFLGSIICMCLMRFFYGWAESAYIVLPTDIAGEYASLVHGLGISILTFGFVLNPILMSLLVPNQTPFEWSIYFLFLAAFNLWGAIIFHLYGSGQPEPWTIAGKKLRSIRAVEPDSEDS